ncbi:MAG: ABC transporter ATP-binding protein [Anaerolineae bacterium]|nr:ABC transporter ATP-binding protein [Anaerolineae bacterium]
MARERTRADLDVLARVSTFLQERLSALREIKSISAESYESTQMFRHTEEQRKVYLLLDAYQRFTPPIRMVTNQLVLVGVMLFGAWQLLQGQISSSAFLLFMFFSQQLIQPLTQVAELFLRVTELSVLLEGSVYILGQKREQNGTRPIPQEGFQRALVLEGVSFAYEKVDVLRNITLTLNKGEMIALVGRSGAGKSTLVDLLLRFYEPDSGTFTLDGMPVTEFKLTDYRRMFGVVSQENILFNDTVYSNIAYARPWLTEEQVRHAAQVANAEPFILNDLEDGYQTMLGERGARLSGGQRQRIAIARAVAHHPQILVLDEATSALDSESEQLVQKAIDRVIEGNTAIVIAHRLSTILRADKIVVLRDGEIVEVGTHAELIRQNGEYRYLYDLQFSHAHTTPAGHPV